MPPAAFAGAALIAASASWANPQGGQVVGGTATIVQSSPSLLTINQSSQNAVLNWQSFSIARNQQVDFNQPNASAIALNRVTGGQASDIAGQLTANGQVWLVNPSGVFINRSAQINVGGLLTTTSDIANANFMAGSYVFDQPGNPTAKIVNRGQVTVRDGGLAAFVAPQVQNAGVIQARLGTVALASGTTFTLDLYGDNLVKLAVDNGTAQALTGGKVSNSGSIVADGGTVLLTVAAAQNVVDGVINVSGSVEARSAALQNGQIVLSAGGGTATVTGTLDASGTGAGQTGGTIEVLGDRVALASSARLDASGDAGGGTILVGGNFHGAGPQQNATTTSVAAGASLQANAITSGNGGSVAVWSDDTTTFGGVISARGGATGGNGGRVETSGKGTLSLLATARVDTSAPNGATGSWLLDPTDFTINAAAASAINTDLATTDVAIVASGSIDLTANIIGTGSNHNLGLDAETGNIVLAANINFSASTGNVYLLAGGAITQSAGVITMGGGTLSLVAASGIGSVADPIATSGLGNIAATSATGGIFVANGTSGNVDVTAAAAHTFNTGAGDTILTTADLAGLTSASFAGVTGLAATTSGDVSLVNSAGSLTVDEPVSTAGALTLTAAGSISQSASGVLTAAGAASFTATTANQSITLNTATNALSGPVSFSTTGEFGDASLKNSGGTILAASTVGGELSVEDTTGSISQSGALILGADSFFGVSSFTTDAANQSITLTNPSNMLSGLFPFFASVSVNTLGNLSLTSQGLVVGGSVGGLSTLNGSSIGFANFTTSTLVATATTGGIGQNGGLLSVSGTASFTTLAANQSITLTNGTALSGVTSFSTSGPEGSVSVREVEGTTLGASTVGGNLTIVDLRASLSQTGPLAVGGIARLSAAQSITLTNPANALAGLVLLSAGGNASLTNAAPGGTTLDSATVGGKLTVTTVGGTNLMLDGGTMSTGSGQVYDAPVVLIGPTNLAELLTDTGGNPITFASTLVGGGRPMVVEDGGGTLTFTGAVSGLASLDTSGSSVFPFSLISPGVALTVFGSSVDAGSISTLAVHLGGPVTTSAGQSYGAATLTANVTLTDTGGGAITFGSTLAGGGNNLTVTTAGNATFTGAASGLGALDASGAGSTVVGASIAAGSVSTGTVNLGSNVTTSAGQSYGAATVTAPAVTLATTQGGTISLQSVAASGKNLTVALGATGTLSLANGTIGQFAVIGGQNSLVTNSALVAGTFGGTGAASGISIDGLSGANAAAQAQLLPGASWTINGVQTPEGGGGGGRGGGQQGLPAGVGAGFGVPALPAGAAVAEAGGQSATQPSFALGISQGGADTADNKLYVLDQYWNVLK